MSKHLFVASLPFEFSNDQLKALFEEFGPVVRAEMVWDRKNNRTRGFGYVDLTTDEAGIAAIAKINGTEVAGRKIWVTVAQPKQEKSSRPTARPSSFPGAPRREFRSDARPGPRRFGRPKDPNALFPSARPDRPRFGRGGDGERRPFRREGSFERKPFERKPFGRSGGSDRRPFNREGNVGRKPFGRTEGSDRRPFNREGGFERKPFRGSGSSDRRPFKRESSFGRKPFGEGGSSDRRPFNREGTFGRKPFGGGSERGPWKGPRSSGPRGPRRPGGFSGDRPSRPPFRGRTGRGPSRPRPPRQDRSS